MYSAQILRIKSRSRWRTAKTFLYCVRYFAELYTSALYSMAHWKEDEIFADKLARLCCDHFNKLNKKGKPQIDGEWTLLAAIVLVQQRG